MCKSMVDTSTMNCKCDKGKERSTRLLSTSVAGENFGRFNLPMTRRELVFQLSQGNPCEVPRRWLHAALECLDKCFDYADVKSEMDSKIVQLTPVRCVLNETGRTLIGG